jgi:hypothetical protein
MEMGVQAPYVGKRDKKTGKIFPVLKGNLL